MFKFQPTTSEGLKAIIVSREGKDAATTFILPQLDKKELLSMLQNKLEGNDWQKTMHADDAITALITMAPDDGEWKEAGKTLVYFSLAGEKTLVEILGEVVAEDSPFTLEEVAICHWTTKVLDTMMSLRQAGMHDDAIVASAELGNYFN
ncbi:MAG: hypothetical protein PHQ45_04105 [Acidaminococcaceae bacterium]|jgi:hypothetical protein|nr:hypothetical protein [Acidaminococcaceae bacterium]